MKNTTKITLLFALIALTVLIPSCKKEDIVRKSRTEELKTRTGELCWRDETAWTKGSKYSKSGWAMYTQFSANSCVDLIAGKNTNVGTVCFSDVVNGKVTITVNMADGWTFQHVSEPVKIQGYDSAPSGKPAPGKFTSFKGAAFSIEVDAANYYGIHIDIREGIECE